MAYEIVPYAPEFESQILQLQRHLWSSHPVRNAAYFRWKYADNPFLDDTLIQLALCDGRVVAMHGFFGAMWQVDDAPSRHLVPHGDDFVVAPEHRNRGVSRQIMDANLASAARRGFPFAVSLSAIPVTFVIALALGWRAAGSYQPALRGVAWGTHLDRLRNRLRRTRWPRGLDAVVRALPHGTPFDCLDRNAESVSGGVSLSRQPRPEEMAALVARLPWDGRMRHVRDAEYFNWRFRNPLHEYRFLFWDESPKDDRQSAVPREAPPRHGGVSKGELRGYLVLQRYRSELADPACVNIADWEASEEAVQAGLLDTALRWGRFRRIQTWTVSLREPVRTLLRDHGFAFAQPADVRERSNGPLVRRLGKALPNEPWKLGSRDLLNIADWDMRMLYSMGA